MSPARPALEDFESDILGCAPGELFNPPGLTNFLGCLQAAPDILAIQHLTFPPFSNGESCLGIFTLNDQCLRTAGLRIEMQWRPDRIVRTAETGGFKLQATTVMGVRARTVTTILRITNATGMRQPARIRILTGDGIIHSTNGWKTPCSPRECPAISTAPWEGTPPESSLARNAVRQTPGADGLIFESRTSVAHCVQATSPRPDRIERRWLDFDWELAAGESRDLAFFVAASGSEGEVLSALDAWKAAPHEEASRAEADWLEEIDAIFTPGNPRYSGHLPLLQTGNRDLARLYLNAVATVACFKREPVNPAGWRTYTTLMPRYWVTTTFINDWSLTALLLVMLDPEPVRRTIEHWLACDIHTHFGTEYVSGTPTGNWYSCNDYAMVRLITTFVRVTGDSGWLAKPVGGVPIIDHVRKLARHYRTLDRGSGLADYGDRNSLLEAVGTYTHEVASLNAANVWMLREAAALLDHLGHPDEAASMRDEAAALVPRVQKLYIDGRGFWNCRQPDGSMIPCRHIWDFIHTLNFLHADLPRRQIDEMVGFFTRELRTDLWLSALSPNDEDIGFSLRPDHQWNGSYPGWVALAAAALVKADRMDVLAGWLPGLARSANQGPFSQAHFVESYASPIAGGARKAPTEWPYINDWAIVCGGAFFDTVLLDLFGLDFGYDALRFNSKLAGVDPTASLSNIPHHGCLHQVTHGRLEPRENRAASEYNAT